MTNTIEEAANKAIIDNEFFMADPDHPEFVERGLEQMRACKCGTECIIDATSVFDFD